MVLHTLDYMALMVVLYGAAHLGLYGLDGVVLYGAAYLGDYMALMVVLYGAAHLGLYGLDGSSIWCCTPWIIWS